MVLGGELFPGKEVAGKGAPFQHFQAEKIFRVLLFEFLATQDGRTVEMYKRLWT